MACSLVPESADEKGSVQPLKKNASADYFPAKAANLSTVKPLVSADAIRDGCLNRLHTRRKCIRFPAERVRLVGFFAPRTTLLERA
jgi:hypothetical protein